MKKYLGFAAVCACLLISEPTFAEDTVFEIPGMSDEIEALIGSIENSEDAHGRKKEELYRLIRKDTALADYGAGVLPDVYDPRTEHKITPVRSQKSNTCWAFSSLAAGEQSMVYKGAADPETLDFSEAHLSYFFYHSADDPLGNTAGDGNHNISGTDFLDVGSNTIFSTFSLANWVGAAKEEDLPMGGLTPSSQYSETLAYADTAHLQNAYWINFKDVDAVHIVKQMIRKYGGAAVNYYWNYQYYNSGSYAYYVPLNPKQANNHSVAIVGWDDTFPKENFKEAYRPECDGAWIAKNSYGPDWGDGGYFYISYEDSAVNPQNTNTNRARAYIFDFEPADNYDYNYQYDGSAGAFNVTNSNSTLTKIDSGSSIANVFRVHIKGDQKWEELKAVSFALFDTAVSYRIQIFKNPKDASDPASGIPALLEPVTGSTSYTGYYTVPLPVPVSLKEGETFSVVVTLEKESGEQVDFFVDKTYQNGNWVSFTNQVKEGESFRFINGSWEDMAGNGVTARIKAFTDVKEVMSAEKITLSGLTQDTQGNYRLDLWKGETRLLQASVSPPQADQKVIWTTSDASVVTADPSGNLLAAGAGTAGVTGTAVDAGGCSVTCIVTVKEHAQQILLSADHLEMNVGESAELSVELVPPCAECEKISWKASNGHIDVDDSGTIEALEKGTVSVRAFLKSNPNIYAVCKVQVSEKAGISETETGRRTAPAGSVTQVSPAKPTKSADTFDGSAGRAYVWSGVLLLGIFILRRVKF